MNSLEDAKVLGFSRNKCGLNRKGLQPLAQLIGLWFFLFSSALVLCSPGDRIVLADDSNDDWWKVRLSEIYSSCAVMQSAIWLCLIIKQSIIKPSSAINSIINTFRPRIC